MTSEANSARHAYIHVLCEEEQGTEGPAPMDWQSLPTGSRVCQRAGVRVHDLPTGMHAGRHASLWMHTCHMPAGV